MRTLQRSVTRYCLWIADVWSSSFLLNIRKNTRPRPQWRQAAFVLWDSGCITLSIQYGHKQLKFDDIPEPDCHGLPCCSLPTCHKVSLCAILKNIITALKENLIPFARLMQVLFISMISALPSFSFLFQSFFLLPSSFSSRPGSTPHTHKCHTLSNTL